MSDGSQIGVTGLAVMGANLARNIGRNGWSVAVHNRSTEKTRQFIADYAEEGDFTGTESSEEFVAALARPRKIIIMVKAGAPVDAVIEELAPLLDEGDILIDAGNSHFPDTQRRTAELEERGLRFLGIGVSGGEEGALLGPSIMPGGTAEAYGEVEEILTKIAAQVDGTPCCTFVGPDGAGHYVKMVHNGIEYADIQLITEAYDLMRSVGGLEVAEIAKTFEGWNEGDLESFLIEITAKVLAKQDPQGDGPLIDVIVDQAEQKGTGRWTSEDALEQGVPLTAITEAVFARALSSLKDERAAASKVLRRARAVRDRGPSRPRRRHRARALREQGGRLRAGLPADGGGLEGQRLGPPPRGDGDDLARRLHHPRPLPRPDQGRLRRGRGGESPHRALLPRRGRLRASRPGGG